jgi:hypothetical protein
MLSKIRIEPTTELLLPKSGRAFPVGRSQACPDVFREEPGLVYQTELIEISTR